MTIRTVPAQQSSRWNLREIVVMAALAVVFGVVYWALVAGWGALRLAMGPFGDLSQSIVIGGWMIVAPLAIYIIRKPLTGVVTEIVAAFIEFAFLGSPIGPLLLLTGLVQGVGAELPFAATGYRRYSWPVFVASGLSAAAFSFIYSTIRFGWLPGMEPNQAAQGLNTAFSDAFVLVFLVRLVLHLTSGVLLAGVLAKVIGDALKRTGVLDNFAIGRDETPARVAGSGLAGLRPFGGFLLIVGLATYLWAGITAGNLALAFSAAPEAGAAQLVARIALLMTGVGAALTIVGIAGDGSSRAATV